MISTDKARAACAWLADRIASAVPPGTGNRADVWDAVEAPSRRFMDALETWERTGDEADKRSMRRAGDDVVGSWHAAARRTA